jgi:hypothetical protein
LDVEPEVGSREGHNEKDVMKRTVSLIALVGLCTGVASASLMNETVVVAQGGVPYGGVTISPPVTGSSTLNFVGSQFDPTLGTLNSVSLVLTANLSDSTVGAIRMSAGSSYQIDWTYSGSLTLLSFPSLSSAWNGSGATTVDPEPPYSIEFVPLGLSDPTASTTLSSSLSPFIGNSTFDLAAALSTTAGWQFTATEPTGEFGSFNPYAGGTLQITYDYTAVPEPTTMMAGALLLLPFGASTIRILRKKVAA